MVLGLRHRTHSPVPRVGPEDYGSSLENKARLDLEVVVQGLKESFGTAEGNSILYRH